MKFDSKGDPGTVWTWNLVEDSSVLFLLTPLNLSAEPAADPDLDEAAASVSFYAYTKAIL